MAGDPKKRRGGAGRALALNDRARVLLKTLVEHHIRDGQPVASKVLARDSGFDVSPATIRNVMADLEELGLVVSPHTSAGRVPTARGYRLFVDSLLTAQQPSTAEMARMREELGATQSVDELVTTASNLLSSISTMAGVVMVPRRDFAALKRIEFLPLSEKRVLAILVINEREVENRILHTARQYSERELQEAANYLNSAFAGKDLRAVRGALLSEMRQVKDAANTIMQTALEMASNVFTEPEPRQDYVLAGQTKLMHFAELSNLERLRQLFQAFDEKRAILHLLDECLTAQTMQVFIGEEAGYEVLDQCSVVAAPYEVEGKVLGVLGVIGPTRMAYDRVIPLVDVTARLLGSILNQRD